MWDSSISKKIDSSIGSVSLAKLDSDTGRENKKLECISENKKVHDNISEPVDAAEISNLNQAFPRNESYKLSSEDVSTLKSYGVEISSENLKIAAEAMKNIPDGLPAGDLVGLLISRKITVEEFGLLSKYANGEIKFSSLFSSFEPKILAELKNYWGSGKLLERLEQMLRLGSSLLQIERKSTFFKNLANNFELQELLSILPNKNNDGSLYFQWPIFWAGQDVPDTLEGEAFVPKSGGEREGFGLRILVDPPSLGKTEISLSSLNKGLSVYFGVEELLKDVVRSICPAIRESILKTGDFKSVRFNVGTVRVFNNFFSRKDRLASAVVKSIVDLKA